MSFSLLQRLGRAAGRVRVPAVGSYLTDGRRLFYVVSQLSTRREDVIVALENCATHELQVCLFVEFESLQLRVVSRSLGRAETPGASSSECRGGDRAGMLGPVRVGERA